MNKGSVCFPAAGILLVSTWLLFFYKLHDPSVMWLFYTGWVTLIVGLLFIFLAIITLRSKGRQEKGNDFTQTTIMVDKGVYAVVRHPLYLGWLLMYAAAFFFSQHWLVMILAVLGIACMFRISKQEDRSLINKFGD